MPSKKNRKSSAAARRARAGRGFQPDAGQRSHQVQRDFSAAKPKMRPATQMFVVGAVAELVALVMLALALFSGVGSTSTIIATFLVCIVLSIIASALAGILALVGLVKYRRMTGANIALLAVSIIFSPVLWLGLIALL